LLLKIAVERLLENDKKVMRQEGESA
jgi:hypothetical protein